MTHLRQSILSALRGFRLSTSSLPLVMNEISPSQPFKTWVPTLILQNLLVMSQHVPHSPGLDISVMSIRTAFTLADEIDMPTLSWLTQTYLAPRAQSTEAILDVVEELCMAISDGFRQNPTSLGLIRRYLHLARSLPESIPRNLTLGPVVNALRSYLADLYQNGDIVRNANMSLVLFTHMPRLTLFLFRSCYLRCQVYCSSHHRPVPHWSNHLTTSRLNHPFKDHRATT